MKNYSIALIQTLFLLLFISRTTHSQFEYDYGKKHVFKLYGRVKKITETNYELINKFGDYSKGRVIHCFQKEYNIEGCVFIKTDYEYNSCSHPYYHRYFYKYNSKGDVIELTKSNESSSLEGKTIYKYDVKGDITEENEYNSNGSLILRKTFKHNTKGYKIEENNYNTHYGNLYLIIRYIYDIKGNKIEENTYNEHNFLVGKETFKYNINGDKIEEKSYYSNNRFKSKKTLKYDIKRNKIEVKNYHSDGKLKSKITFKYNANNHRIEEKKYNSKAFMKELSSWKYEYDKKGNWTKIIYLRNNIEKIIYEREIEFH